MGWDVRFWGQELFCFILVSLKRAMGSCSALLFPHITGGQTLPHLRSQMQGLELGEGISVALSWLNTRPSSGLPHCCSGIRP